MICRICRRRARARVSVAIIAGIPATIAGDLGLARQQLPTTRALTARALRRKSLLESLRAREAAANAGTGTRWTANDNGQRRNGPTEGAGGGRGSEMLAVAAGDRQARATTDGDRRMEAMMCPGLDRQEERQRRRVVVASQSAGCASRAVVCRGRGGGSRARRGCEVGYLGRARFCSRGGIALGTCGGGNDARGAARE